MVANYPNGPEATVRVLESTGLDLKGAFALKAEMEPFISAEMEPFISRVDPISPRPLEFGAAASGYTMGREQTTQLMKGFDLGQGISLNNSGRLMGTPETNVATPKSTSFDPNEYGMN